jgi:DNA-binding transcriptional LysR family regulator
MLRLRDDATREMARLGSMTAGSLTVAAHEAAAVYLLPVALRTYVKKFPDIKVGIYRSRLEEIPRQVMDRQVDVGFVKEAPTFHELQCIDVHSDEMVCITPPSTRWPASAIDGQGRRQRAVRAPSLPGRRPIASFGCSSRTRPVAAWSRSSGTENIKRCAGESGSPLCRG